MLKNVYLTPQSKVLTEFMYSMASHVNVGGGRQVGGCNHVAVEGFILKSNERNVGKIQYEMESWQVSTRQLSCKWMSAT